MPSGNIPSPLLDLCGLGKFGFEGSLLEAGTRSAHPTLSLPCPACAVTIQRSWSRNKGGLAFKQRRELDVGVDGEWYAVVLRNRGR